MDYQIILDKILSIPMFQNDGGKAYNPSLDKINRFCSYIGSPQNSFKSIHIAGTNGKGSVSNLLASIFEKKGHKTALYTSPHQKDFRERIRVNGEMIPKDAVIKFMGQFEPFIDENTPSFFELTTAMAFWWFAKCEVDIAIVECGLGGRLDATNVITPELSIITNISNDHNHILGNTFVEIASEKGGIIKPYVPVVIGEWDIETSLVLINRAKEAHSPHYIASQRYVPLSSESDTLSQSIKYLSVQHDREFVVSSNMLGGYQAKNIATVLTAIDALEDGGRFVFTNEDIELGLNSCRLQGRYQYLSYEPRVICDSGHNVAGVSEVVKQLLTEQYERLIIVFGVVFDKDVDTILSLLPKKAYYIFTKSSVVRALNENELCQMALLHGLQGECCGNVKDAIVRAKEVANGDDLIFVGGSCFTVADAL